jgi:tetratricopeptide (TPR) repeat protein
VHLNAINNIFKAFKSTDMGNAALVALLLITVATNAQKQEADSFLRVLRVQKTDSLQTQTVLNWMEDSKRGLFDSATYYPTQIIQTGQHQANTDLQALGHALFGYYQTTHNNPSLALEHYLKALALGEERNNPRVMLRLYHFRSFYGDAKESIAFQQQVIQLAKQTGELNWEALANSQIGNTYLNKLQQYDSALAYLQRAYEITQGLIRVGKLTFASNVAVPTSLGFTFMKLNNPTLALAYFRVALQTGMAGHDGLDRVYEGLATFFKEAHDLDSSFYYATRLYQLSQVPTRNFAMRRQATASNLLYQIYKERGNADSALKYHEIYKAASDSENSIAQAQKVESLLSLEKERQAALGLKKKKEEEARKHNLQYSAIALGMVALLIGFLVLSHSILANQKLIRFLGIVSLLIVFEFLNLLLHPWLGQVTHESPLLMLLIMVAMAAVLVPMHHRLEHWITHKLVEKNNRIRLAAAKRTIQQLEGKENGGPVEKNTNA